MSTVMTPEWMSFSACKDDEPSLYDEAFEELPPSNVRCGRCPVRAHCLTYAIEYGYEGVWGGTTLNGRRTLSRRQKRVHCPGAGCNSRDIERGRGKDTCVSCGLSWPSPRES